MLWEAMVAEMRATYTDLAARAKFTEDGKKVHDTRFVIDEWVRPAPTTQQLDVKVARTAGRLTAAHESGFVEVG